MLVAIRELDRIGDWARMRDALGEMLGLQAPVSDHVLMRARSDDRYAGYLLRSRNHPDLLERLLADADRRPASRQSPEIPQPEIPQSDLAALQQAGKAALRWAASGFERADPERIERRLESCRACPHLREAPDRMLYKVALVATSDPRICGACGCVVSRKAALATEACPVEDTAHPGLSNWGEPLALDKH